MGQLWGAMSDEEKGAYQQRAAEERERVAKELEAWKAAGGQLAVEASGGIRDPNALIFPIARIRKICKLDSEVRGMSKEAIMLITKCAELATAKLGVEAVRVAQLQNRRKLLPEDVANVCAHREQFMFLKDDVKDLIRNMMVDQQQQQQQSGGTAKKSDTARDAAAAGSKPLTSYFGLTTNTNSKS
jgi:DNA-directed RNA polymerase I subunit RPA43